MTKKRSGAAPGSIHVGIAYCDGIWFFRRETSWDRGFLRLVDGCLEFKGYGTGFRLPVSQIDSVWIVVQDSTASRLPRVYLRWRHPVSGANILSFEIRNAWNRDQCFDESERLVKWIQNLEKTEGPFANVVYPFESTKLDFATGMVFPTAPQPSLKS